MTTGYSTMTKAEAKKDIRQMKAFFDKEITSKQKAHDAREPTTENQEP